MRIVAEIAFMTSCNSVGLSDSSAKQSTVLCESCERADAELPASDGQFVVVKAPRVYLSENLKLKLERAQKSYFRQSEQWDTF